MSSSKRGGALGHHQGRGAVASGVAVEHVVRAAARHVHASRRLELGGLASELGISRVTLHRRVGNREQLLAQALRFLAEQTFVLAERHWEVALAAGRVPEDSLPSLWKMADFRRSVGDDPGLKHLIDEEPGLAMRLLTDPRGVVQPFTINLTAALLQRDVDTGVLRPLVDVGTLSYALIRLGESFLYADVLAARTPDLDVCTTLINALVLASSDTAVAPGGAPR